MKTVISIILPLFLIFHVNVKAQEVVASGVDHFSNSYGSISSTVGEPVTETYTAAENVLTQGYQQTRLVVTAIDEGLQSDYIISAFPNPATEIVKIKVETKGKIDIGYKLFDFGGKVLMDNHIEASEADLGLISLPSATYLLKIYAGEQEIKIFKIIKQ